MKHTPSQNEVAQWLLDKDYANTTEEALRKVSFMSAKDFEYCQKRIIAEERNVLVKDDEHYIRSAALFFPDDCTGALLRDIEGYAETLEREAKIRRERVKHYSVMLIAVTERE